MPKIAEMKDKDEIVNKNVRMRKEDSYKLDMLKLKLGEKSLAKVLRMLIEPYDDEL